MASLSPTITKNNLVSSAQERFSVNVSNVPKNNIIAAYKNITRDRLPLPPLALSEDKTLMIDVKSPLTGKDYKTLFSSTSTKSQLRRIAKKVDLMNYLEMTKDELVRQITEYLSTLDICEPVELQRKRKTTKNVVSNTNNFESLNNETPSLNNNNNFKTVNNNFGNNGNRTNVSLGNGNNGNRTNVSLGNGNRTNVSLGNGNRTNVSQGNRNRTNVSLGNRNRTTVSRNGFTRGPAPKGRNQPKSMRNKNLNGETSINKIKLTNINRDILNNNGNTGFFGRLFGGSGKKKRQTTQQQVNNRRPRPPSSNRPTVDVKINNTDETAKILRKIYNFTDENVINKIATFYDKVYSIRKVNSIMNNEIFTKEQLNALYEKHKIPIILIGVRALEQNSYKNFFKSKKDKKLFELLKNLFYEPFINAIKKNYNIKNNRELKNIYKRYLKHLEKDVIDLNIFTNLKNFVGKVYKKKNIPYPVSSSNNNSNSSGSSSNNSFETAVSSISNKNESFDVKEVRGDNRCMFRAVALGLEKVKGRNIENIMKDDKNKKNESELTKKADLLREQVVKALCSPVELRYKKMFEKITNDIKIEYKNENDPMKYYCNKMSKTCEWGGERELFVISKLYKRPIKVYTPSSEGKQRMIQFYGKEFLQQGGRKIIKLLYVNKNHYNLLVDRKNSNSQSNSGSNAQINVNQLIRKRIFVVTNKNNNNLNAQKIQFMKTAGIAQATVNSLRNKTQYNGENNYSKLDAAIKELFKKNSGSNAQINVNQLIRKRIFVVTNKNNNNLNAQKIQFMKTAGIAQATVNSLRNKTQYNGENNYSKLDAAIKELFKKNNS